MTRFSLLTVKLFTVITLGLCMFAGVARAQGNAPIAFTVLGPAGAVARVITTDAACPQITIDGKPGAMSVRAAPDQDFPITVCDAAIPLTAKQASINGQPLKLPVAKPQHIVVVGDTGCRLKGSAIQACNDTTKWPYAPLSGTAAKLNPDLVIHVGDYHYREVACDETKADCKGSPFGDNWAAWNADLFAPGLALLQAAPWVIVPGNHEDCARAGTGYFRLLDPRPMPTTCPNYTDPYALSYLQPQLIVVDDSTVNDFQIDPAQLTEFQKEFQQVNALADKAPSWVVMHDPMYVFGHLGDKDSKEQLFIDQLTLQKATNNSFPSNLQVFISGHVHLFQVLSFDGTRPPQMVVGNSGTLLDKPISTPLTGLDMGGMKVAYGTAWIDFGFVEMERAGDQWAVHVKDVTGADKDKCLLGGGKLVCGQTTLPSTGADVVPQWWLLAVLLGAVLLCLGVALGVRNGKVQTLI